MTVDMVVPVAFEVPGEDVAFPPFPPVSAASVIARDAARPEWDDLTVAEAIEELRKGTESIYFADFEDDPRILVGCPNDGRVTVDAAGYCQWGCGYDFTRFGGPVLHVA